MLEDVNRVARTKINFKGYVGLWVWDRRFLNKLSLVFKMRLKPFHASSLNTEPVLIHALQSETVLAVERWLNFVQTGTRDNVSSSLLRSPTAKATGSFFKVFLDDPEMNKRFLARQTMIFISVLIRCVKRPKFWLYRRRSLATMDKRSSFIIKDQGMAWSNK